jgi:hypothetical protein
MISFCVFSVIKKNSCQIKKEIIRLCGIQRGPLTTFKGGGQRVATGLTPKGQSARKLVLVDSGRLLGVQ